MEKQMIALPSRVLETLLRTAGAPRVGEGAKMELHALLQSRVRMVSEKAIIFAQHAGRKTVRKEDVRLAILALSSDHAQR